MKGNGVSPDEAWPAIVAAQDGWNLTNLACNGAGFLTPGDDSDCAETFSGLVALTVALKPETVIISGSSNDFGRDDSALVEETTTEIAQLRSALPNARIIGLSTVWGDTDVPAQLAQVNSQVQQAVEKVGGAYLDIGQPLQGHPEWMQWDGVHPTAAGQLALSAAIQIAFREGETRPGLLELTIPEP